MMQLTPSFLSFVVACLLFTSCTGNSDNKNALFSKLDAKETGIDFNNINVENEQINILTYEYLYNGGGVAAGDVNNDGLPDLYFTSNNRENKLYLNKGEFKFEDITATAGVGAKGWKTGATMADVNGDGLLDIYVSRSADGNPANRKNLLYINNGGTVPTFTEKAAEYGVDDDSYSTQAVFFDLDRDGDLDLFTLNHSLISISNKVGIDPLARNSRKPHLSNRLFRNDDGKFTDISDEAGVAGGISNYGLSVTAVDFNEDGWTDIYVTNDYAEHDHLYINEQGKKFTDVIKEATGHVPHFSMGSDAADINRDGLVDLFAGDMLPEDNRRQKLLYGPHQYDQFTIMLHNELHYQYMRNMLQLNNGDGTFSEIGQIAGVSNTDWSWATLFADYDNDGWNDLFVSNGYKRDFTNMDFLKYREDVEEKLSNGAMPAGGLQEVIKKMPSNKVHNYMFRNKGADAGGLQFEDMSSSWGFEIPVLTNGAAYADLDLDGDLDLVMNNMDEQAGVYRNNAEKLSPQNKSIRFRLKGNAPNTQGIGTKVRLYQGSYCDEREMQPVRGFQSGVDFTLHFGLGNSAVIDSAVIIWHSGKIQRLTALQPGQLIELRESDATGEWKNPSRQANYFEPVVPSPIAFEHKEDEAVDFNVQSTLPCFQSRRGPGMAVGDVNNDKLEDIYLTGAQGQSGELWVQQKGGKFVKSNQAYFNQYAGREDVDAVFTDVNGDKSPDLVIVSGGYLAEDQGVYVPRVALNDGQGNFSELTSAITGVSVNAAVIRAADVDGDGDSDLFIGARSVPKRFPLAQASILLLNDGRGFFAPAPAWLPSGGTFGIISDAVWTDLNRDSKPDLIVAGEYNPVRCFINQGNSLVEETATRFPAATEGWWLSLKTADVDGDGDEDLIAGNWGLNNQMKVDEQHPARLAVKDFDGNGSVDPIPGYTIQGKLYPGLSLDELLTQLPSRKKIYTNYESYSGVDFETLLSGDFGKDASFLELRRFATTLFINDGSGRFSVGELPLQAQFSPVYAIETADVNQDGITDLLLAGNQSTTRISMGKMDANYGLLLLGKGNARFEAVPQHRSGLRITGDVKALCVLSDSRLVAARNNTTVQTYRQKKSNQPSPSK
jgi:hypothetical protein